jgi:hypothetical protein
MARQMLSPIVPAHNRKNYFMTDADIQVGQNWITGMISQLNQNIQFISGPTAVQHSNLFGAFQNADWLYNLGVRNFFETINRPMAANGTNMAIFRETYIATGGFEKITHSITEDYDLFKAVIKNGNKFKTYVDHEVLAYTAPEESFGALILQQQRWLNSTSKMPLASILGIFFQNFFLVFIILLSLYFENAAFLLLFLGKWLIEIILLKSIYRKLRIRQDFAMYLYSPYAALCNIIFSLAWALNKE